MPADGRRDLIQRLKGLVNHSMLQSMFYSQKILCKLEWFTYTF